MTQTNPLVKPFINLIFDILPNVITRPSGSAPIKVRANIKRVFYFTQFTLICKKQKLPRLRQFLKRQFPAGYTFPQGRRSV